MPPKNDFSKEIRVQFSKNLDSVYSMNDKNEIIHSTQLRQKTKSATNQFDENKHKRDNNGKFSKQESEGSSQDNISTQQMAELEYADPSNILGHDEEFVKNLPKFNNNKGKVKINLNMMVLNEEDKKVVSEINKIWNSIEIPSIITGFSIINEYDQIVGAGGFYNNMTHELTLCTDVIKRIDIEDIKSLIYHEIAHAQWNTYSFEQQLEWTNLLSKYSHLNNYSGGYDILDASEIGGIKYNIDRFQQSIDTYKHRISGLRNDLKKEGDQFYTKNELKELIRDYTKHKRADERQLKLYKFQRTMFGNESHSTMLEAINQKHKNVHSSGHLNIDWEVYDELLPHFNRIFGGIKSASMTLLHSASMTPLLPSASMIPLLPSKMASHNDNHSTELKVPISNSMDSVYEINNEEFLHSIKLREKSKSAFDQFDESKHTRDGDGKFSIQEGQKSTTDNSTQNNPNDMNYTFYDKKKKNKKKKKEKKEKKLGKKHSSKFTFNDNNGSVKVEFMASISNKEDLEVANTFNSIWNKSGIPKNVKSLVINNINENSTGTLGSWNYKTKQLSLYINPSKTLPLDEVRLLVYHEIAHAQWDTYTPEQREEWRKITESHEGLHPYANSHRTDERFINMIKTRKTDIHHFNQVILENERTLAIRLSDDKLANDVIKINTEKLQTTSSEGEKESYKKEIQRAKDYLIDNPDFIEYDKEKIKKAQMEIKKTQKELVFYKSIFPNETHSAMLEAMNQERGNKASREKQNINWDVYDELLPHFNRIFGGIKSASLGINKMASKDTKPEWRVPISENLDSVYTIKDGEIIHSTELNKRSKSAAIPFEEEKHKRDGDGQFSKQEGENSTTQNNVNKLNNDEVSNKLPDELYDPLSDNKMIRRVQEKQMSGESLSDFEEGVLDHEKHSKMEYTYNDHNGQVKIKNDFKVNWKHEHDVVSRLNNLWNKTNIPSTVKSLVITGEESNEAQTLGSWSAVKGEIRLYIYPAISLTDDEVVLTLHHELAHAQWSLYTPEQKKEWDDVIRKSKYLTDYSGEFSSHDFEGVMEIDERTIQLFQNDIKEIERKKQQTINPDEINKLDKDIKYHQGRIKETEAEMHQQRAVWENVYANETHSAMLEAMNQDHGNRYRRERLRINWDVYDELLPHFERIFGGIKSANAGTIPLIPPEESSKFLYKSASDISLLPFASHIPLLPSVQARDYNEDDHNRDEGGKYAEKGSGGKSKVDTDAILNYLSSKPKSTEFSLENSDHWTNTSIPKSKEHDLKIKGVNIHIPKDLYADEVTNIIHSELVKHNKGIEVELKDQYDPSFAKIFNKTIKNRFFKGDKTVAAIILLDDGTIYGSNDFMHQDMVSISLGTNGIIIKMPTFEDIMTNAGAVRIRSYGTSISIHMFEKLNIKQMESLQNLVTEGKFEEKDIHLEFNRKSPKEIDYLRSQLVASLMIGKNASFIPYGEMPLLESEQAAEWDESKHPRAADGKFGTGSGTPKQESDPQQVAEKDPDKMWGYPQTIKGLREKLPDLTDQDIEEMKDESRDDGRVGTHWRVGAIPSVHKKETWKIPKGIEMDFGIISGKKDYALAMMRNVWNKNVDKFNLIGVKKLVFGHPNISNTVLGKNYAGLYSPDTQQVSICPTNRSSYTDEQYEGLIHEVIEHELAHAEWHSFSKEKQQKFIDVIKEYPPINSYMKIYYDKWQERKGVVDRLQKDLHEYETKYNEAKLLGKPSDEEMKRLSNEYRKIQSERYELEHKIMDLKFDIQYDQSQKPKLNMLRSELRSMKKKEEEIIEYAKPLNFRYNHYDRTMEENPDFIKSLKKLIPENMKIEQAALSKFANETHSSVAEWYNSGQTTKDDVKIELYKKFISTYEEINS